MKWFKHLVGSTSDPDLMEAETLYKANGTYVFFRTLEILAREDVFKAPLIMNFDAFRLWFPAISKRKLIEILQFFDKKNRFSFQLLGKNISIYCDKLSTISSDYAVKIQNFPKKIQKNTVTEVRSKKENKNKNKKENKEKIIKHKFGEYSHVLLSDKEKAKLIEKFTLAGFLKKTENLDEAIEQYGYKYKNHYLTILKWDKKNGTAKSNNTGSNTPKPVGYYEDDYPDET